MTALSLLVVTAMYPHGANPGNGAFVAHQVDALRRRGHRVDVIHVRGNESRWEYLKGLQRVFRETVRSPYDIVHVHYGLTGLSALARWHTPMVVTLHGSDVLLGRVQPCISRIITALAASTIVVSPRMLDQYPNATVVPCGVDLDRFYPGDRLAARIALGITHERAVLFPYDPARRVKRYDLAAAAVEELRRNGLDAVLTVVHGVSNQEMVLRYQACDAMILCSDSEGSPTSIKEALACNLPVVSTAVGDVEILFGDAPTVLITEQSVQALAEGLRQAFAMPTETRMRGRATVEPYSLESTADSLENVYSSIRKARNAR